MLNKIIYVTFFFALTFDLFAQSDIEKKVKEEVWKKCTPEFKATTVPARWKNESAVVLATMVNYSTNGAGKIVEKVVFHTRIKLQDKSAVEEYSELSFDNKQVSTNLFGRASSYYIMGVKVIKTDNSEKEIDLTKGVKSDAGSSKDFKIAIPDLEPGDIIDYFISVKDESETQPSFNGTVLLEEKYPVVKRTFIVQIPDKWTLHNTSFNNAPKFVQSKVEKESVYTLVDTMRERSKDLQWSFPHLTSPEVRYRLSNMVHWKDPEDLSKNIVESFYANYNDIGIVIDFMSANFRKEKDQTKIARELFYLLRNPMYLEALFQIKQGTPLESRLASNQFFSIYNNCLEKYDIHHQVILAPARSYGKIEDQVDLDAIEFFIKTNTNPNLYISRPTPFSIPGQVPYIFEGALPIAKDYAMAKKGDKMEKSAIPVSSPDSNITISKCNLKFEGSDFSKVAIQRSVLAKGHNKPEHQYLIFTNYDYIKEYDQPKYQEQSSGLMRGILKDYNKEKLKLEQRIVQDYQERDERIKKSIESDMEVKVSEYKNLKIKTIGMWDYAPHTDFTDEFTVENITKKAGANIILEIGKIIEQQTEIKDDARVRDRDINMVYPRSFKYEIALEIPQGYTLQGIESLNKNVTNETGGFISNAVLKDGKLIVTTNKYYSSNHFPASEWSKMLQFLDAAVEFNKSKVLLKKI